MLINHASRKAAPMSQEPSVRMFLSTTMPVTSPPMTSTHVGAPLATIGSGSTSAYVPAVANPAFGAVVAVDARVRDAKQAAPPRGQRC